MHFPHFSITQSIGENPFKIEINDGSGRIRAWIQTLDRNDGSYIVRFKLYTSPTDLKISLLYQGNSVGSSPFIIKG